MPLVLNLKEGREFEVGGEKFVVSRVYRGHEFELTRKVQVKRGNLSVSKPLKRIRITDRHATEIVSDVFVSAGLKKPESTIASIVIEAPPEIQVLWDGKKRGPEVHG